MKKVKVAFWIVVIGLVALIVGQNWEFFKTPTSLLVNLFFAKYETPHLANAVFFVAIFFIGLLISYFFSLFKQYKDGKTIKTLRAKEASLVETVSSLEKQLAAFEKPAGSAAAATPIDAEPLPAADGK
ncbi:MAG: hypothetical protein CR984_00985 [Proteobacteria bacterium]|nr:MAG: hypothetical protein CR984_00985 [Pseudomonadota bacterium]PIE66823.1 MAG: hypothetical protein CSA23_07060 [Deltaproteobacteria bacterium]